MKNKKCPCCFKINPDPKGKARAKAEAKAALARMDQPGWTIRLHHNLTWHWRITNRFITVFGDTRSVFGSGRRTRFYAMMSTEKNFVGSPMYWCPPVHKTFRDPNKAALYVLLYAKLFSDRCKAVVEEQQNAMRRERE